MRATAIALVTVLCACSSSTSEEHDGGSSPSPEGGTSDAHQGDATWYNTGLGACGVTNDDSQAIAALATADFDPSTPDSNPNHNTLCGKRVTVCREAKCVTVTVEDRCVGCKAGDIDLSPSAFEKLAPLDAGRIAVTWRFD